MLTTVLVDHGIKLAHAQLEWDGLADRVARKVGQIHRADRLVLDTPPNTAPSIWSGAVTFR